MTAVINSAKKNSLNRLFPELGLNIGLDHSFNDIESKLGSLNDTKGFPPLDVIQYNNNEWLISMAVAGFTENDLSVSADQNTLTVEGNLEKEEDDNARYLWKGIAERKFKKNFAIANDTEVEDASLNNGILNIYLKRHPSEENVRKIQVQRAEDSGNNSE